MGYSCTAAASRTLAAIVAHHRPLGLHNALPGGFWERGGENADGAITGTVFKDLPGDRCQKVGSFRIEPNGSIAKFPLLTADAKERIAAPTTANKARSERIRVLLHSLPNKRWDDWTDAERARYDEMHRLRAEEAAERKAAKTKNAAQSSPAS